MGRVLDGCGKLVEGSGGVREGAGRSGSGGEEVGRIDGFRVGREEGLREMAWGR